MYSHIKPLATLLACLLDVDLTTDITSKLKASSTSDTLHKGNTCSGSSRKKHGREREKKITYLDHAEMS